METPLLETPPLNVLPAPLPTYVITGATSGIGLATAEQLAATGARIIGVGRSADRCLASEIRLQHLYPNAMIHYCVADLSLQSQVHALAEQICTLVAEKGSGWIDGLINNAGTFTYWLTLTAEGFETQWAVNHLAPYLLTRSLLPLLRAAPCGRVVTVSSDSHYGAHLNWNDLQLRRTYNGLRAYEQTKLANILFTQELNRVGGIRAFAADPGLVKTDIGLKGTPAFVRWIWQRRRSGGISAEQAAQGIVYLVREPSIQEAAAIYWKHGKPKQTSRAAQDAASAQRLWGISQQMCGIGEIA